MTTLASLARVDAFLGPNGPSTMSARPPGAAAQRAKMHSALSQSGSRFEETLAGSTHLPPAAELAPAGPALTVGCGRTGFASRLRCTASRSWQ